jgi:ubiquinone/menaquinone biosynthesis C-methylase UbiE
MGRKDNIKPDYGNWVSKWLLYMPAATTLFFLALSSVSRWFTIASAFFLIVFAYFAYAYFRFSPAGGDIQTKIRDLVLKRLQWNGKGQALDIGCGNGALVIKLAGQYPQARVTGIDYWGGKWGYSKEACRRNAKIEGVSDRTTFKKASASSLPFKDGHFNAAVSNFVFHEVKDSKDKRDVVREAFRVVKKGGAFAFQDLFLAKTIYGDLDDLLETIRGWGVRDVNFENTSNSRFIPGFLKLPFMVGAIGIIYGTK